MMKSYSRQQKTVALSSAEAELHAMVAVSVGVLGIVGTPGRQNPNGKEDVDPGVE